MSAPPQNDQSRRLTAGKFDANINKNTLYNIPKQAPVESLVPFRKGVFGEEKKEDILTDNECNSLKYPPFMDFNMQAFGQGPRRSFADDRFSNSPHPFKENNFGFADNLTDNEINEAIENIRNFNPKKRNSITDSVYLKRLSATSFSKYNTRSKDDAQNELVPSRETSNGNKERSSFRMQLNNMNNEDQLKFFKSLSHFSNLAHQENNQKGLRNSMMTKIDDIGDLQNSKRGSAIPLEDSNLQEFEKMREAGFPFNEKDYEWLTTNRYNTRNFSKRGSAISNLSLMLHRGDQREDN